ncbi:MAG: hypothetical protein WBQ60_04185 [Asticcacaulis sp.]
MFWLTSIFELFSTAKKLKASKAYAMSAVSRLVAVLCLGMFATLLAALMTGGLLIGGFYHMQISGMSLVVAGSITALCTLLILGLIAFAASRMWRLIRVDIEQILRSQAPLISPVMDRVSDVAGSFMSGLRHSAEVKARSKKR